MEYCEGGSLETIYKKIKSMGGRVGEKVLIDVAGNVLNGLVYLHQHHIIHRDIKPSNVLMSQEGMAKICDFGVSGDLGPEDEALTCIGTSYYMAPERITGQKYTITSDVWSLGITLMEMACNRFPYPSDEETLNQASMALIDFVAYITRETIELNDEPDGNVMWSSDFKDFVRCW
jgi:mitogen-activated protein kinase kinase